ncbi:restriction endonuclease subunit S [Pectinatus frisingensis]|uniref:restriction endonuclease subunit S n=1 Tax=Pectinatus frisingensis TaxID=865 RepID=UPI003D801F76
MAKQAKVPKLRFPGFTGEWEERKLGGITLKIGSGKTPHGGASAYVNDGIPLIRSQNIVNDGVDLSDVVYITDEIDAEMQNSRVNTNDVLLNITGASIGRSAVYSCGDPANVNQHVCIIRPEKLFSGNFIQLQLASTNGQNQINTNQAGGAREGLNFQQISKIKFYFPKVDEQKCISEFFLQMNRYIALHQRKLTHLQAKKKSLLQKMFPKKGERFPELRFPGFTDAWEQRKLGDIADVTKLAGFEFTKYVTYADDGNIIALRGLNVKKGNLVLDDVKYIDGSDFSKLNRSKLYKNDILLTYVGTVGELAIIPENDRYYLAPNVARIRVDQSCDSQYAVQVMGSKVFYDRVIFPLIATSSQPALSMENVRKFILPMPCIGEQQHIGAFFKEVDNLITLHQRKLTHLKTQKKALLQQMFV